MTSRVLIRRNSKTHVALLYLKMVHRPVTKENLFNLAPAKYKELNKAELSLDKLVNFGFAKFKDNMYTIPLIVKQQPKKGSYEV
jgi:hypothetical protein